MTPNRLKGGGFPSNHCTAEHLIPESAGGRDDRSNIVAACRRCNGSRGNLTVSEWIAFMLGQGLVSKAHLVVILQRIAKFGIELPIGHPALAAPTVDQTIVRAPEVEAPAP